MSLSLRFALLCDYASNGAGGKPIAVHIFERFNVTEETLEHPLPRFSILARIECSIADGNSHALELVLVDEDGSTIAKMNFPPAQFHSQGAGQPLVAGYTMQIEGLRVKKFGTYEFRFRVGGVDIGMATFNVVKLPASATET